MKVLEILSTDIFSKVLSGAQTLSEKSRVPNCMDVINMYGELKMTIKAQLDPIDLLYMVESNHKITPDKDNTSYTIKLNSMDVVYNFPDIGLQMLYEDHLPEEIQKDPTVLTMLSNSLSESAQQRFATNGFINRFIKNNKGFNGWNMELISIGEFSISPTNPSTPVTKHLHEVFERNLVEIASELTTFAATCEIKTYFSKNITYRELVSLLQHDSIHIANISYGIQQMIQNKFITEEMYSITQQRNVLGNFYDAYEYDLDKVNEVLKSSALFPVVIEATTLIHNNSGSSEALSVNQFDKYVEALMKPNFDSILPQFTEENDSDSDKDETVEKQSLSEESICQFLIQTCIENGLIAENGDVSSYQNSTVTFDDLQKYIASKVVTDKTYLPGENYNYEPEETHQTPINSENDELRKRSITFYVDNGNFDSISKIEQNPKYRIDGTIGIICMPYEDDGKKVYYMGHPIISDIDETVRYSWTRMTIDEIFSDVDMYVIEDKYDAIDKDPYPGTIIKLN